MDETEYIELDKGELAELIKRCSQVRVAFAPGRAWLKWIKGEPMPEAVKTLAIMRGVLNENMDGSGI